MRPSSVVGAIGTFCFVALIMLAQTQYPLAVSSSMPLAELRTQATNPHTPDPMLAPIANMAPITTTRITTAATRTNTSTAPTTTTTPTITPALSTDGVLLRRAAVVEAFEHSWRAYESHAWGRDELKPLSAGANDAWGGFAITMIDGLSTALLLGLHAEAGRAIAWLDANLVVDRSHFVSVFEMTIRALGGLISAHDLSGDARLLKLAVRVADRLLPAFSGATGGLPSAQLNMRTGARQGHSWARGLILAEVGSVQVEFARLFDLTNEPRYEAAARSMELLLGRYQSTHGLYGRFLPGSELALNGGLLRAPTCVHSTPTCFHSAQHVSCARAARAARALSAYLPPPTSGHTAAWQLRLSASHSPQVGATRFTSTCSSSTY